MDIPLILIKIIPKFAILSLVNKQILMLHSIIKLTSFSLLLIFFFSCDNSPKKQQSFEVEYKGALKNIMHKGDLSAKTSLSEFEHIENLYALGAIENLKGEIQIFNGEAYNSYVEGGEIKFDSTYSKKATLFVYATVKDWVTLSIPQEVRTEKELESYLEKVANENNIDTKQAFPFLIQGKADELTWHVIDWKDGDTEHSHEKHISSGLNGTIKSQEVKLLGFYSDSHHAIFTHHTTNMHIHMKLDNGEIAGHLDEFKLGANMTLKLPIVTSSSSID